MRQEYRRRAGTKNGRYVRRRLISLARKYCNDLRAMSPGGWGWVGRGRGRVGGGWNLMGCHQVGWYGVAQVVWDGTG